MPTPLQLKLIHIAYRQAGLDEENYRLVLRNAGGVSSAKELTQAGYEDCMSVFEDSGFRQRGESETYWRDKVTARGAFCGERMAMKIQELAAGQRYELAGLCERFSGGRVRGVSKLKPREAWKLIEMLKAAAKREVAAICSPTAPPLPSAARSEARTPSESLPLLAGL